MSGFRFRTGSCFSLAIEFFVGEWLTRLLETGTVIAAPKTSALLPELQGKGLFTATALMVSEPKIDVYSHFYGALIGATKFNRKLGQKVSHEARRYAAYGKSV